MSSNIIPSNDLGPLQQDGHLVLTSLMMSLVKSTKSSILQKILETLGNILRAMSSTSHGEQQLSPQHWEERMLSQEFSSLTIQISRDIKKQERDGSKAFISTTLTTFSRLKTMLSTLVIVSS